VVGTKHKSKLDLLQAKALTNVDQRNKGHAVMETHVFGAIYMFSPDCVEECYGTLPTLCEGHLHSLE
jgi:hypothetical protein